MRACAGATDIRKGVNGFAFADLNRDGLPDFIATVSPPVSLPGVAGATTGNVQRSRRLTAIDELAVFINEGGFRFRPHRVEIRDSKLTPENFDGRAQVPNLADFNGDGFLDVFITRHSPVLDYWPGEYRQGVMCWKNLLRETGTLRLEKITGNGLHREARLKYNREKQLYEPADEARAPGLPYLSLADVDGDGSQDILGVGPDSDFWAPRVEHVTGRFWKNLGGFRFEDPTAPAGFSPLNYGNGQWMDFFEETKPARWATWRPVTLDLLFAADPDNSVGAGQTAEPHRYESKVYWNTGTHGAKANNWLHLTLSGLSHAELIGAHIELTTEGKKQHRWIHSNHSYKSGGARDAHFGLGKATSAEVKVTLLNEKTQTFEKVAADKSHQLTLAKP